MVILNQSKMNNPILQLSFQFSLDVIDFSEKLETEMKYIVANQLLKSGTSVGANVRESQGAESKLDFIHKLKIAYKEAEETEYWLLLCKFAKTYPSDEILLGKVSELKKLLGKIIGSSRK